MLEFRRAAHVVPPRSLPEESMPVRHRFPPFLTHGFLWVAATSLLGWARAASADVPADSLEDLALRAGMENVTAAQDSTGTTRLAFENRRYRQIANVLGSLAPATPGTIWERRLGLTAAQVGYQDSLGLRPVVRFPSDGEFPPPPSGPVLNPTFGRTDFLVRPLLSYELGGLNDALRTQFELEPEGRWNPWPGGLARAGIVLPIFSEFEKDAQSPDLGRIRPGAITFEQYIWSPGTALLSGTGGLFGRNRYGVSLGIARPLLGGRVLLDAQGDMTGFIAFTDSGTVFSSMSRWSGFAGAAWRPLPIDASLRIRAARFQYGDQGIEGEIRRTFGDLDIAFFGQRTKGFNVTGFRLAIPLPPNRRPTGMAVRLLPPERFSLDYRDQAAPVGIYVRNVASREDYLRGLHRASLIDHRDRFTGQPAHRPDTAPTWVSLVGTTGFVTTPWAGVMPDRRIEAGYCWIPKAEAWDHRDQFRNEVYYAAIGFLPRVEVSARWTVIPGFHAFADLDPESDLTDADRMLSGRLALIEPRAGRPGLAVGIDDAGGTRRFHSTYIVAGMPLDAKWLRGRVSLGYAPRVFTASRHVLDGPFGAVEISPWRPAGVSLEHDSERWNAGISLAGPFGLRLRTALLSVKHLSFGAGWSHSL
jgi:hypothetical protein